MLKINSLMSVGVIPALKGGGRKYVYLLRLLGVNATMSAIKKEREIFKSKINIVNPIQVGGRGQSSVPNFCTVYGCF